MDVIYYIILFINNNYFLLVFFATGLLFAGGSTDESESLPESELEAASRTGDFTQFLKKFAPMPKS